MQKFISHQQLYRRIVKQSVKRAIDSFSLIRHEWHIDWGSIRIRHTLRIRRYTYGILWRERKVVFQNHGYEEEEGVKWWSRMCMEDAHRYSYVSTYFMSLKAASYPASFTQGTSRRCSKSTETYSGFLLFIRFPLMAATCRHV